MNPIALYLASGDSLYAGALLLLVHILLSPRLKGRWPFRFRNLAAALGLCFVLFACAPFPWIVYGLFSLLFIGWFVSSQITFHSPRNRTIAFGMTVAFSITLIALPLAELPHRLSPNLSGPPCERLAIIGDSLSAGIDPKQPPWPSLLEEQLHIPIRNLSQAGAQLSDAPVLAAKLLPDDHWVLIEMGGNDLIANVPGEAFERQLDTLLRRVAAPGRRILMFELPLLPHKISYGRTQRRLAAAYGITLLPKHILIDVIRTADGTSDGLHLSPAGARRMAEIVAHLLAPVIPPPADTRPAAPHTTSIGKTPA